MNPILQMVIHRVVSEINGQCRICDGALVVTASARHRRVRCARCGADAPPRLPKVSGGRGPRVTGAARASALRRRPSSRRLRAR